MSPEIVFALQGLLLGFYAGVSPGPLTTLLVGESLNHGRRAGWRLAIIPLCTDPPVLAVILPLLIGATAGNDTLIGLIAVLGAVLLAVIAVKSLKVSRSDYEKGDLPKTSFGKAFAINITNPNLYIGWLTINGTMAVQAYRSSPARLAVFLAAFYLCLLVVKCVLVLAVGSARHSVNLDWLVRINRFLAVALFLFACWFFRLGIKYLFGV